MRGIAGGRRAEAFVLAALAGALAVAVVASGVGRLVDGQVLGWMPSADRTWMLHAVAAPLSEEVVKALVVLPSLALWSWARGRAPGPTLGAWAVGLGAGFAVAETWTNQDFAGALDGASLVSMRIVGHASFALCLLGGVARGLATGRVGYAWWGLVGAIGAHAAFNALGLAGAGVVRAMLYGAVLLVALAGGVRFAPAARARDVPLPVADEPA